MNQPFDPFDEKHRNRVKRRSKMEIAADAADWRGRLDYDMRRALKELGEPDYVTSDQLTTVLFTIELWTSFEALRRNITATMERCGYSWMRNVDHGRGLTFVFGKWVKVWKKNGAKSLMQLDARQVVEG